MQMISLDTSVQSYSVMINKTWITLTPDDNAYLNENWKAWFLDLLDYISEYKTVRKYENLDQMVYDDLMEYRNNN